MSSGLIIACLLALAVAENGAAAAGNTCSICVTVSSSTRTGGAVTKANCDAYAGACTRDWAPTLGKVPFTGPFACDSYSGSSTYSIKACANVPDYTAGKAVYDTVSKTYPGFDKLSAALAGILTDGGAYQKFRFEFSCIGGGGGYAEKTMPGAKTTLAPSGGSSTPKPSTGSAPKPSTGSAPKPSSPSGNKPSSSGSGSSSGGSDDEMTYCQTCMTVTLSGRSGAAITQQQCSDFANQMSQYWFHFVLPNTQTAMVPMECAGYSGSSSASIRTCNTFSSNGAIGGAKIFNDDASALSELPALLSDTIGNIGTKATFEYSYDCGDLGSGKAAKTVIGSSSGGIGGAPEPCDICLTARVTGRTGGAVSDSQCGALAALWSSSSWAKSATSKWTGPFKCDDYSGSSASPTISTCTSLSSSNPDADSAAVVKAFKDTKDEVIDPLFAALDKALTSGGTQRTLELKFTCPTGSSGYSSVTKGGLSATGGGLGGSSGSDGSGSSAIGNADCAVCMTSTLTGRGGASITQAQCNSYASAVSSQWWSKLRPGSPAMSCSKYTGGAPTATLTLCTGMSSDAAKASLQPFFQEKTTVSTLSTIAGQILGTSSGKRTFAFSYNCKSGASGSASKWS